MSLSKNPLDRLARAAIAAAMVPALDAIQAAKETKGPGENTLTEVDEAIQLFEDKLHEIGFEVVMCPDRKPVDLINNLERVAAELGAVYSPQSTAKLN
jgi:hypothetical protein